MIFLLLTGLSLIILSAGFNLGTTSARIDGEPRGGALPFGNVTIHGSMKPTSLVFPDGLTLSLYSMCDRNLSVERNDKPSAPGEYVTPMDPTAMFLGSSFWTAINSHSWVLKFDQQSTHDVVTTIEVPYNPVSLEVAGISRDNIFLAKYDASRAGWVIDTTKSSINGAQNRIGAIGLLNSTGEYMLVGRKVMESRNILIQPGSMVKESEFNILAPPAGSPARTAPSKAPVQIGTWTDGFQIAVRSCKAMRINMNFVNASNVKIQSGYEAISGYGYSVNSTNLYGRMEVIVRLPFHQSQLDARSVQQSQLRIAQFVPTLGEFRVGNSDSKKTSGSVPKILSRGIEAEYTSVDVQWMLVAPTPPTMPAGSNSNSTLVANSTVANVSLATGTSNASASTTSLLPDSSISSNSTANTTLPATSMKSVGTALTSKQDQGIMQQGKDPKPNNPRSWRVRIVKSENL